MIAHRRIARTRVLAALAAALAATATGAKAQEGVFMKDMLGTLGLTEKERPPITYRERAPLVLPPGSNLPTPIERGAAREANAAWPKDPEITARERRAARDKAPIVRGEQGRMNDNNTTLSINEMRAGRRPGAEVQTEATYKPGDNNRASFWLDPLELLKGKKDDAEVTAQAEPERDLLSQPPAGYRRPPGGVERGPAEVKAYNPDRDESDPRAFQRQQARR
jgi:hypothetical protein